MNEQIVAFVSLEAGVVASEEEILGHLAARLPGYMLPSRVVIVSDLPKTPAGKVDRAALHHLGGGPPRKERTPPRSSLEQRLAALWSQVLNVAEIGVEDDFFADLGGHSLIATQLVSLIRRELEVDLPLRSFFEHPTIAALAEFLSASPRRPALPAIPARVKRP